MVTDPPDMIADRVNPTHGIEHLKSRLGVPLPACRFFEDQRSLLTTDIRKVSGAVFNPPDPFRIDHSVLKTQFCRFQYFAAQGNWQLHPCVSQMLKHSARRMERSAQPDQMIDRVQ